MNGRVDRLRETPRGAAARLEPRERPLPVRARRARTQRSSSSPSASGSSPTSGTRRRPARSTGFEFVDAKRDLFQTLSEQLAGKIGFEATSLSFERYSRLHAGGIEPVPRYGLVEELRAVKDEDELDAIRRAAEIANTAFERFADEGDVVGRTERELAWRFEQFLHEANAEGVSFPVTMASGPNAAKPHTELSDRRIEPGETLLVDAGCIVDGYCSDCTRTFATGSLPDELKHAYEVCLDAQLAALEAVRPGASGPGVDSAARDRIAAAGYGEAFGHGLGHGIGLVVHEDPRARSGVAEHPRGRQRGHRRAGHLPVRPGRDPDRGPRHRHGRRARGSDRRSRRSCELSTRLSAVAEVVNTNQFKNGMHIEIDGGVWRIVEFQHVKPGKGGAFVRTKVKNLDSGAVVDRTFRAGEKFQRMHTEVKSAQYLYDSGDDVVFMEDETYEQFSLPRTSVAEDLQFIPPSTQVQVLTVDGKPSGLQLPSSIELTVAETEPGVKGDTVSNVTKPAKLETGATVQVPLFVNTGDRIKVDPREGRYISRA